MDLAKRGAETSRPSQHFAAYGCAWVYHRREWPSKRISVDWQFQQAGVFIAL